MTAALRGPTATRSADLDKVHRLARAARFMFERNVPNTTRAHRAAIKRLWTRAVEAELGSPPDPRLLVSARGIMLSPGELGVPGRRVRYQIKLGHMSAPSPAYHAFTAHVDTSGTIG